MRLHRYVAGGVLALALIGTGAFGALQYQNNGATHIAITRLQDDIRSISSALHASTTESTSSPAQTPHNTLTRTSNITPATSITEAVQRVSPSVVSIIVSQDVRKFQVTYINPFSNDPLFRGVDLRIPVFSQTGSTTRQETAAGSGFFVHSHGYIMTDKHVVSRPGAYYTVVLSSGAEKPADVVYRDPDLDLAILHITGDTYPAVTMGDSSTLQLGQPVAAIGNTLGQYDNSVSVGVVSGLDRTIEASDESGTTETLDGVIQTDAAINPGDSGGPLLDASGQVVGINVATATDANNVSFAIPINKATTMLQAQLPK